jgi:hypothetical protein
MELDSESAPVGVTSSGTRAPAWPLMASPAATLTTLTDRPEYLAATSAFQALKSFSRA